MPRILQVKSSETLLTVLARSSDQLSMRMQTWMCLLVAAIPACAESNPSWWTLVPVNATAIVGMDWQRLKASPFGAPVAAELSASVGIPELPCLTTAREILIASPDTLALLSGEFNAETLRADAGRLKMKPSAYHGVSLWIAPGKDTLSIARLSDQLILAGSLATLDAAIDRSQADRRRYCPLLSRAARYAQAELFVVADRLPDALASIFVPIEAQTKSFEGYLSLSDGMVLEASLDAGTEDQASTIAENLRQEIPSLPAVAQSMEVKVEKRDVYLSLELDQESFAAALRSAPAQPPALAPAPAPEPVKTSAQPVKPPDPPKPAGPQVIRIYGLDDGTREIVLPPAKPDKP